MLHCSNNYAKKAYFYVQLQTASPTNSDDATAHQTLAAHHSGSSAMIRLILRGSAAGLVLPWGGQSTSNAIGGRHHVFFYQFAAVEVCYLRGHTLSNKRRFHLRSIRIAIACNAL